MNYIRQIRKILNQRYVLLAFLSFLSIQTIIAQTTGNVTINVQNQPLGKVIETISKQTGLKFFYSENVVTGKTVTLNFSKSPVNTVLAAITKQTQLNFSRENNTITISTETRALDTAQKGDPRRITGIVIDDTGEAVIGANIVDKSRPSNGTISGVNGDFSLDLAPNSVIAVSYIGYAMQEINVGNSIVLNIQLKEDTKDISEVVVIGYGTQKKVNLTGSVTSISSEVLNKRQVGQTSLALQGTASGVTITQRSGQPGADGGQIRIRGIGTLNNSDPLILVDGLEMGINNIDVSTIESISVLKDAASASIYGSKAANGVILITTKRATEGKFNIAYSGYVAQQSPTDLPKKVNAIDHIMMLNESKINAGAGVVYTDEQINNWKTLGPTDRDHYPDTDWQKAILRGDGFQQNHNLTLTGGTDKLKILASLGYMGQNGIIDKVNFQRISLRINTDITFSKQFSSSLDVFLYNSDRNSVAQYSGNSSNSEGIGFMFYTMNKFPAVQAMQFANGNYGEGQNGENPVNVLYNGGFYNEKTTPMMGNFSFKWTPSDDFWIQTAFSPSISYPMSKSFLNRTTTYNPDGSVFSTLPAKSSLTM
ncbi:MAG: SusC/RagA family TonB-linked outer membrane protein, partial [Tannerella sp.]|nr:SusC/RagA family TonB-linked outer membrane protein [Tannerella sp.]